MGGRRTTTHNTTTTPNDYDDAWIRSKFDAYDTRANEFSNWRAGREASIGFEAQQRAANRDSLAALQGQSRQFQSDLEGLGAGQRALGSQYEELGADFRGLGATTTSRFSDLNEAQRQQFKDIYNLKGGPETKGVATQKGLAGATRARGGGAYGGFNRGGMRISSLNV